jgi:hypothetical protein
LADRTCRPGDSQVQRVGYLRHPCRLPRRLAHRQGTERRPWHRRPNLAYIGFLAAGLIGALVILQLSRRFVRHLIDDEAVRFE